MLPQNRRKTGPARDALGRILPGASLNPGGRPKTPLEIRELLTSALPVAVDRLVDLVNSKDERIALLAIQVLLNRVLGRDATAAEVIAQQNQPRPSPFEGMSSEELLSIVRTLQPMNGAAPAARVQPPLSAGPSRTS
jgi:hypothetical protein